MLVIGLHADAVRTLCFIIKTCCCEELTAGNGKRTVVCIPGASNQTVDMCVPCIRISRGKGANNDSSRLIR